MSGIVEIRKIEPCADSPGSTLEGWIKDIDLPIIEQVICINGGKAYMLGNQSILIGKLGDHELYFYRDGKFIITKCITLELGKEIIHRVIKEIQNVKAREIT